MNCVDNGGLSPRHFHMRTFLCGAYCTHSRCMHFCVLCLHSRNHFEDKGEKSEPA